MNDRKSFFGQAGLYGAMALISLAGLADAVFLTVERLTGSSLTCVVSASCSEVLASPYATIGSIPIAMLGAAAYFLLFSAATLSAFGHRWAELFLVLLIGPMLGATLWLLYVQAFVLHAFCDYCLLSAVFTFALVGLIFAQRVRGSSAGTAS